MIFGAASCPCLCVNLRKCRQVNLAFVRLAPSGIVCQIKVQHCRRSASCKGHFEWCGPLRLIHRGWFLGERPEAAWSKWSKWSKWWWWDFGHGYQCFFADELCRWESLRLGIGGAVPDMQNAMTWKADIAEKHVVTCSGELRKFFAWDSSRFMSFPVSSAPGIYVQWDGYTKVIDERLSRVSHLVFATMAEKRMELYILIAERCRKYQMTWNANWTNVARPKPEFRIQVTVLCLTALFWVEWMPCIDPQRNAYNSNQFHYLTFQWRWVAQSDAAYTCSVVFVHESMQSCNSALMLWTWSTDQLDEKRFSFLLASLESLAHLKQFVPFKMASFVRLPWNFRSVVGPTLLEAQRSSDSFEAQTRLLGLLGLLGLLKHLWVLTPYLGRTLN